jgi:hypothetical protein
MKETGVLWENQRSVVSHWQTLSHSTVVSGAPSMRGIWTHNFSGYLPRLHYYDHDGTFITRNVVRKYQTDWTQGQRTSQWWWMNPDWVLYTVFIDVSGVLFLLVTLSTTLLFGQAIWLSNLSILSVPDEGYSINTSSALHLIFSFLKMICKFSRNCS